MLLKRTAICTPKWWSLSGPFAAELLSPVRVLRREVRSRRSGSRRLPRASCTYQAFSACRAPSSLWGILSGGSPGDTYHGIIVYSSLCPLKDGEGDGRVTTSLYPSPLFSCSLVSAHLATRFCLIEPLTPGPPAFMLRTHTRIFLILTKGSLPLFLSLI